MFNKSVPKQTRSRFGAEGGPVPVLAAAATTADVPVYLDAVGTIKALNTVTVSPQVDGKLISVGFQEGDDVKKGDVLARIDPTTYQAQLDQAKAKKAQDQALLANAKVDLERYQRLAATNAINAQQADTQKALVAQNAALVQSDQAAVESAQATLGYTTIVAPIDGRTGIRQVDEGNIVRAAGTTTIVVITQIKPISVIFNLPQQNITRSPTPSRRGHSRLTRCGRTTTRRIDRGTLKWWTTRSTRRPAPRKLKAEFPNPALQLWPGQVVTRNRWSTLERRVVIPTGARSAGRTAPSVYVVKDENTAAMRPNIVVQKQDETQTVVKMRRRPPERVVTTGFVRSTDRQQDYRRQPAGLPAGPRGHPATQRPAPSGGRPTTPQ